MRVREYFEVFGAVEPATGEKLFMTEMPPGETTQEERAQKKGRATTSRTTKGKGKKVAPVQYIPAKTF